MKDPTTSGVHGAGRKPGSLAARRFPAPLRAPAASPSTDITYDLALLARSRASWESNPALRLVYGDIFRSMRAHAFPGPALELGSGCGSLREFVPDVVTSDVESTAFADLTVSAYAIEDAPGGPWSTLYLFDVLHHLREPMRFFASASRALRPGGRVIICDPAATPFGRWFYRLVHHEGTRPAEIISPYEMSPSGPGGEFANMGMAWALFVRDRNGVSVRLRSLGLEIKEVLFRDALAYPATGGFSKRALLPSGVIRALLTFESALPQRFLRACGLRVLVVLEKRELPKR